MADPTPPLDRAEEEIRLPAWVESSKDRARYSLAWSDGYNFGHREALASRDQEVADLQEQLDALDSWHGLLELLDRHWPESLIPTMPDRKDRDPGPRIVSLTRYLIAEAVRPTGLCELCGFGKKGDRVAHDKDCPVLDAQAWLEAHGD